MNTPRQIDRDKLRKDAEAGDANAQYMLAATLIGAGDRDEGDRWLNAAADQGHSEALYTLATRGFYSSETLTEGAALARRAADAGSVAAMRLLGVAYAEGFGVAPDWAAAVEWVLRAAQAGAPQAMSELALLLFANDPDDPDGAALIAHAATRDAGAAAVAVRRAAESRAHADASLAANALKQLTAARYPNSAALDAAFKKTAPAETFHPADINWDEVSKKLHAPPAAPQSEPEVLCAEPAARAYRGAFTPEECEYVIASTARLLAPSLVVDPRTGQSRRDPYRNSLTGVVSAMDLDLALVMINARMAALAGRRHDHAEFLSILCYRPGEEYRPHFDWLPEGEELERSGQRVATALLTLNDDYDGGETHFLSPDVRFRGRTGDVLVFDNVLADGTIDMASRHAGLAVTRGAKFLGSRWFREKKYNF